MRRLPFYVLVLALMGCGTHLSGRYADAKNTATYIDFHADGTAFVQDTEGSMSGTYRQSGDHVVVTLSNGHADDFTMSGNTLTSSRVTLSRQ